MINTEDLYQLKLNEVKRLFSEHNYLRKYNRVVYEDFLKNLTELELHSDELLRTITAIDLHQKCNVPILIARRLEEIFQMDTGLPINEGGL